MCRDQNGHAWGREQHEGEGNVQSRVQLARGVLEVLSAHAGSLDMKDTHERE
jgi:hypothetical protein